MLKNDFVYDMATISDNTVKSIFATGGTGAEYSVLVFFLNFSDTKTLLSAKNGFHEQAVDCSKHRFSCFVINNRMAAVGYM